mmetsp:Transcript_82914/g.213653  ORF Transcript_82914/g.213653 Transcript_82914/m.213653 type:complete len:508 (-) Transcript_82914:101-1624(-)
MAAAMEAPRSAGESGALSARRSYPRVRAGERVRARAVPGEEGFQSFLGRTAPALEELKENVFDKSASEPFRNEERYMGTHITIAPPEEKLSLSLRDTRTRALPSSLRPEALKALERPLRCMDRSGKPAPGHPSDQFADEVAARAPPQPIPEHTQKLETEFIDTIEKSLHEGQSDAHLWDQYAKRAEHLLITMSIDKVLRVLKAFVLAKYRGADIYTHIGGELAKEVKNASSTRLCQVFHWLARAGLRDQTLMTLMGNETLLRLNDDFVLDMYIEVLNVHAKLDIRNPRLINAILRDLTPLFAEFGRDQCCAVAPITVMQVLSEQARVAYLSRCAELGMGLPVRMTKPAVLRQFRLLEDCLRLDYHPTTLPHTVQLWLANLKQEADAQDVIEPAPLTHVEQDILRVLTEEMDIPVQPTLQDGILTLHLTMGKTVLEVLDSYGDYFVTPAMGGQKLLRADTKLRQRLLWRRGWRVLAVEEEEWLKLSDDMYKKDRLEDTLVNGPRSARQ